MRSVVVHTRRADDHLSAAPPGGAQSVKVRMGKPRVWNIEFMSQGGDLVRADNNALGAAARSLGLPGLAWPAGRCAAEFIQCDQILKPVRNSIFSGILVFANQARGKAEPNPHPNPNPNPHPNPNPDPHPNPRMTRAQRRQEDLFKQREEVLQRREQRLED